MEILEFIFSSFWRFAGVAFLLLIISNLFTGMFVIDKSVNGKEVD